jgi:Flagellar protein YcgR/PilZ domain
MTEEQATPRKAKFSDMDLRVGQSVQLIYDGQGTRKEYTSVIGYVENDFVMLRVPQEQGWVVHVREGMAVEIRLFSGLSIFTFQSRINALLLTPRNYMLLSFPSEVQETPLRSHHRVRTSLPVEILNCASGRKSLKDYHIHDLSGGGVSIVGPWQLGETNSAIHLGLRFDLQSTGKTESVELEGTIQNVELVHQSNRPENPPAYQHGIKFKSPDARVVLLVHELQQRKK